MNIGWNFRREHLPLEQRSHYIITDGGDQPNVVPRSASVWYYFRQTTYPKIKEMWDIGDQIAKGAAMMTGTELLPTRVLGSAWPQHFNKAVAEAAFANIQRVGLPQWSEADQTLARALQKELGSRETGLTTKVAAALQGPAADQHAAAAPTTSATCRGMCRRSRCVIPPISRDFPATTGRTRSRWPRRSRTRGSPPAPRCMAMTMIDLLTKPALVQAAWDYFRNVQTKDTKYEPLIREQDKPAIELNKGDDGQVPRRDAQVLLRPVEVQDVSRAVGHRVPDG